MGVFPLADTMIRFSNAPWSRGNMAAGASGWTNEGWWYPHSPPNARRDAAAVHSPTELSLPSALNPRCFGTGRLSSGAAPAALAFAAGNRLQ